MPNPHDTQQDKENLPCPHGRPSWRGCPHCLGINKMPVEQQGVNPTHKHDMKCPKLHGKDCNCDPKPLEKEGWKLAIMGEYIKQYHDILDPSVVQASAEWLVEFLEPYFAYQREEAVRAAMGEVENWMEGSIDIILNHNCPTDTACTMADKLNEELSKLSKIIENLPSHKNKE